MERCFLLPLVAQEGSRAKGKTTSCKAERMPLMARSPAGIVATGSPGRRALICTGVTLQKIYEPITGIRCNFGAYTEKLTGVVSCDALGVHQTWKSCS